MGITGLNTILKEKLKGKGGIRDVDLSTYKGQRLAIDINIYLHGFAYNPLEKKSNSHIDGFFQMICDLLKHHITPIMILDGTPPQAKADTIKTRSDNKKELKDKAETLAKEIDEMMAQLEKNTTGNVDELVKSVTEKQTEMDKYVKRDIKIKGTMYDDLKTLFTYMGIPCIRAKGEADALCVRLYQEGLVAGVLSEDMDILPFGGKLIRGIKEKRIATVTEYDPNLLLHGMSLTQSQLADLCILCGCDYSTKIKSIGPKTALSLLIKYQNIEGILEKHIQPELQKKTGKKNTKYDPINIAEFKKDYLIAREVFLNSPKEEIISDEVKKSLSLGKLDQGQLLPFLMERCKYKITTLEKKMMVIQTTYSWIDAKIVKAKPKIIKKISTS